MKFEEFLKMYYADMETRLREHTMRTKKYIIDLKILPYFGQKRVNDIIAADIRRWQNELIKKGYSPIYLKTINNQLSAIFNYAVKYYDLKGNPCTKAGSIGKSRAEEMSFWTIDEFRQFVDCIMDKRQSYMCFMILYWTGMRLGEMLALTKEDIDFDNNEIRVTKSLQRIEGEIVITPPKTKKGIRTVKIPEFLTREIEMFIRMQYGLRNENRIFMLSKSFLHHELDRGCDAAGVKRIRIHDLRHPYVKPKTKKFITFFEVFGQLHSCP